MNKQQKQEIMEQRFKQLDILTQMGESINDLLEVINDKTDEYIELGRNLVYKDKTDERILGTVINLQKGIVAIAKEQLNLSKLGKELLDFDNLVVEDESEEEIIDAEEVKED